VGSRFGVVLAGLAACFAPNAPAGAPCSSLGTCPTGQMCHADTCVPLGAGGDASPPSLPASCRAIHASMPAAPSGAYTIDPGDGSLEVACDMVTAGGGWTIVFLAPTSDEDATPIAYTSGSPALLAAANDALVAFRDADGNAAPAATTFELPDDWRTSTPFDPSATDVAVAASVDEGPPEQATLRYGSSNFLASCDDDWDTSSAFGRICVQGTLGPFYSGFASSGTDGCVASDEMFDAHSCSPSRTFSIAVR
jgi:hypothetical protein